MRRLRILIILLVSWIFIFFNIERLAGPMDISIVAYVFVPTMVVITLIASRLTRIPVYIFWAAPIPIFLTLKVWAGKPVSGAALPLTVMEMCAIVVTMILARWVGGEVNEFENAVTRITIGQIGKLPPSFSERQGEIYQEVRRARNYQRPLVLMAIGIEDNSVKVAIDRMVNKVQQTMAKRYALSGVAKTLCQEMECSLIALNNDHFLVLLPELTPDKLPLLTGRLRKAISEQVGVTLRIGVASLPQDALTFDAMVEKAVAEMEAKQQVTQPLQRPPREAMLPEIVRQEDLNGHVHS
jgi:GGDEF domain-containing protein